MKFLVLGCNGMAGHLISLYLKEQGHDVTGFARSKSKLLDKTVVGDARNLLLLGDTIEKDNYDSVINCIGILNKYAESDHEAAVFLNSYLPHFLSKITSNSNTQIIQMSTDCVFSGKKGNYTEDSFPDGTLFYDRSKALGELNDDKNVTLRNSIVGPDIKPSGIGLINWFLQQHDRVKGYKNAIWTGQTTLQLAKTMEAAAAQHVHGLFNMVPNESISKYDMLILFNKYLRTDPVEIEPEVNFKVDKSLIRTHFDGFDYEIPDYETQIKELGDWMRDHKELYPQYNL